MSESHLIYPNLAALSKFDRDLNYTGIISEGWDDPLNLVPVVLLVLCLYCGLPSGFQSIWALSNAVIFHPMDYIVGALGRGPNYLTDEYAIMDTRYWPLDDPTVTWISNVEFVVMLPLCFFWYKGCVQGKWYRHVCGLLVSGFQMMGCILYLGPEWQMGFIHLPTHDFIWPPTFDSYIKLKYFWAIFVGCNLVWLIVPTSICYCILREMERDYKPQKQKKQ
ncbi:uncharacterized protein LOC135340335 [Halichondria panicea]|uniref:uncharacterized protein LOC135340335 n=1 Tax=Halichondria panicea TaxID=6063 RepID=UPI00312B9B02